ncbi:MAG: 16S rRNA (uracil(1498)-N(3))-methyltransferase [Acidobacteria bacterium]|nr:MAG: 16S rRNA (uracil(1498)-N(3))-methyltransferase [Acidobacteriota bacterium]
MNLLLLDAGEIDAAGRVRLTGRRADHLRKVLRVTPGRTLRAGVVRGPLGRATVTAVAPEAVELEVVVAAASPPPPRLELIVALPRPQVLHRVLQFATAMGVRRIDLINAWRVEKSFFASPSLEPARIDRQVRLGAEQGMTTWLPEVALHRRLVPFADALAARPAPRHRLLAEPASPPLAEVWPAATEDGDLALAIGPEGGWIEREVETFRAAGFTPASLGPWVLRVEAAVVAALAEVELLRRLAGGRRPAC